MNRDVARKRKAEGWVVVSLWLEPDTARSFRELKAKWGLKHDTEVLRLAINDLMKREGMV